MTLREYIKENNLPKMNKLGELKNFRYYLEDMKTDEDVGLPIIIVENKKKHSFEAVNSNRVFDIMDLFG